MRYNERSLEEFKKEYSKRFPNSNLQILSFINNIKVLVKTEFGDCIFPKKTLLRGAKASIKSAINKNEYFTNQIKNLYSNYDFSLLNYLGFKKKIEIICKIHGNFHQRADHLLNGIGCPKCGRQLTADYLKINPTGWSYTSWINASKNSKNFDSFKVYIIECWNEEERFYKIGKTFTKVNKRFDWKHLMPYEYNIVKIFTGSGKEISELETKLKNMNKLNKYSPKLSFPGKYECYIKINNHEELFT